MQTLSQVVALEFVVTINPCADRVANVSTMNMFGYHHSTDTKDVSGDVAKCVFHLQIIPSHKYTNECDWLNATS